MANSKTEHSKQLRADTANAAKFVRGVTYTLSQPHHA